MIQKSILYKSLILSVVFIYCIKPTLAQKPIGNYSCGHSHLESSEINKKANDFDIVHYSINLDFTDFQNQRIEGYTEITFDVQKPLNSIGLQLEGLQVDSIASEGNSTSFDHDSTDLTVHFGSNLLPGLNHVIRVYYKGKPTRDASWGGVYYSGEYAFNLGVAFTSAPHNYGRVWFPCVDNFSDRATYDFNMTCTNDKKVLCNGILTSEVANSDSTKTFTWEMNDEIPTYLASFAVAPYTLNTWNHKGIPVILASVASDSANMAASFKNLNGCIDAYLNQYGPHTFDRIGFNAVPFNGGAMEHATNIAYPRFGVGGDLTFETLYAHELGHHWWGNTVTCRTAEDMWINEGWASYSERVFLEWVYGKARYDEDISANHRAVLHYAHLRDGDTLAISGVSHENTYGSHVYDKGADVAHTLRGYMGDSSFFEAIKTFMTTYKFKDVSSQDLMEHFQKYTTANLTSFFDNWVYNEGFPHFQLLGYQTNKAPQIAGFVNKVDIGQRLRFAPTDFTNVPIDVTFYSKDFEEYTTSINYDKSTKTYEITTPFIPVYVALDFYKKISDAITDDYNVIYEAGEVDFVDAMMKLNVIESPDSSLVRIEHNWVGADAYFRTDETPFLSRERFWTVDGVWNSKFKADATIEYFGRETGTNYLAGYLDVDLLRNTEENLVLMYRPNAAATWDVCPNYSWDMGSKFDKRGSFTIHNVQKGQYCFAITDKDRLSVRTTPTEAGEFVSVFPNPTTDSLNLTISKAKGGVLEITNTEGKLMLSQKITSKNYSQSINVSEWAKGLYYVGIVLDNKPYQPKRVLVR
mgnify:CR=1 FL=1